MSCFGFTSSKTWDKRMMGPKPVPTRRVKWDKGRVKWDKRLTQARKGDGTKERLRPGGVKWDKKERLIPGAWVKRDNNKKG